MDDLSAALARATTEFVERAGAAGLLDVAYTWADSPFGPILVAATPAGLVRLAYPDEGGDGALDELARRLSPRVVEAPARLDAVRRELEEYFEGRRRRFEVEVDWALCRSEFARRVLRATAGIPFGELRTYREMATSAGNPAASRAAGGALGSNPIPIVVPCHRVVRTGGGLGGYTGGLDRKRHLLAIEGLTP